MFLSLMVGCITVVITMSVQVVAVVMNDPVSCSGLWPVKTGKPRDLVLMCW